MQGMKTSLVRIIFLFTLFLALPVAAEIPATPVMTFYQFSGGLEVPYYALDSFLARGPGAPAGTLTQGSSIVPCLVVRDGKPVGMPYVGFEVVVDARNATRASTAKFKEVVAERRALMVPNHHCSEKVKYVINLQDFFPLEKPPFFDPPGGGSVSSVKERDKKSNLDTIVRAFHNSPQCAEVNQTLIGRRSALASAWERFMAEHRRDGSPDLLEQAKNLDYVMRTAIFEGHLERGCNAYGACERNIIALSIRNRGANRGSDYQAIATKVSQYNIWDEFLNQISGISSCFLRSDLATMALDPDERAFYEKIRGMYEQNVADIEQILFGGDEALSKIFPQNSLSDLKSLRHYYHAPAMGKCFPRHPRAEYITASVASKGNDYALIANTRIHVDEPVGDGYRFRSFVVKYEPDRDAISLVDAYPGFVIDGKRIDLKGSSGCVPYGVPSGCAFKEVGRYRKTPSWLHAGRPVGLTCKIQDRGETCGSTPSAKSVTVGGTCDTEMRPVCGVR